jgi:hypothetical protein
LTFFTAFFAPLPDGFGGAMFSAFISDVYIIYARKVECNLIQQILDSNI